MMPKPETSTAPLARRAVAWWAVSLALAAVLGLALSWSVGIWDRWGALPAPQSPAWYDCEAAGERYALEYLQGSDRIGLQWSDGTRLQGESFPDRIEWRAAAALGDARQAALPRALRYEAAQRLELRTDAKASVVCLRRAVSASAPSAF